MLLAIDVGNTKIKFAVFEQNTLVEKEIASHLDWKNTLEKILKKTRHEAGSCRLSDRTQVCYLREPGPFHSRPLDI